MKVQILKIINIVLIAAILWSYQNSANARAEEQAAYDAEVEKAEAAWEEYEAALAEAAAAKYVDGTYTGTGIGFGGEITVSVVIDGDEITNVTIVSAASETPSYLAMAEAILEEIVDAQGTDVDAISGATFSSKGILDAVDEALEAAKVEE